jgi:oligopeptide/dipeptide ABC transporter ATP-binding protein
LREKDTTILNSPESVAAPLLSVEDLRVYFRTEHDPIRAADGVSFNVAAGETVALVGESGSGKSVTALALTQLMGSAGYIAGGRILFDGRDLLRLPPDELRRLRGAAISYVFQDPSSSLNPVFRAGWQVAEALRLHRRDLDAREETLRLFKMVGLADPARCLSAYPHEMSGGMQQRVMIAMALACRPRLLVADEPTTALDVTVQAQILDLLVRLQAELGMAVLLITHNLTLVAGIAARVNVMYAGRVVESGATASILRAPAHPYTRGLLQAVPRLGAAGVELTGIPGSVPHPARLPPGCKFHPRCPQARPECRRSEPELTATEEGRFVRCPYWK